MVFSIAVNFFKRPIEKSITKEVMTLRTCVNSHDSQLKKYLLQCKEDQ